jgi:uncharacterized protein (DUF433 family)
MAGIREFREAFEAEIIKSYGSYRWQSGRAKLAWIDLSPLEDKIALPLYSIATRGGHTMHVYGRNDAYFAGVPDPDSLKRRLLEWHAELADRVERFVPEFDGESADHLFWRSRLVAFKKLIEVGIDVCERWRKVMAKTEVSIDWMACELIEQIPGKVSGRPIVRCTRILPDAIVNGYEMGESIEDLREGFPSLSIEQIERLIAFAQTQRQRKA